MLATLGVYLGLTLAGATPQVLASAAMTRQFDVKDDIEVKDDLDTKPDDERSPVAASIQIYLEDVEYFLASLARIKNQGKFDAASDKFSAAQNDLLPCAANNRAGRYTPIRFVSTAESLTQSMEYFSRGMGYGYSLGDCLTSNEFGSLSAVDSRFSFSFDGRDFSVKIAVRKQSPQRALELLLEMESTLRLFSTRENNAVRQSIIERTSFRVENDQVFVITSLPRGSLDSLLATHAK